MRFSASKSIRRKVLAFTFLTFPLAAVVAVSVAARGQQPTLDKAESDAAVLTPATVPAPAEKLHAASPYAATLRAANTALQAARPEEAARLLKGVKVNTLEPKDARRWRGMAVLAALRTGDRAWMDALNNDPEHFRNAVLSATITAMRFLQDGEYQQARALLDNIRNPEQLDEIPRRRYLQLRARLEQLEGKDRPERAYVAKLVDFAGRWPSETCQSCHSDEKKYGNAVTTLDVANWWVGQRFTDLLKQHGDAPTVRTRAEKVLAANPNDVAARLRIAYALRAEGQPAKAEQMLRSLPWAAFPDREFKTPPRVATFP
jgi:Tfp pilus assembly protein PilF